MILPIMFKQTVGGFAMANHQRRNKRSNVDKGRGEEGAGMKGGN